VDNSLMVSRKLICSRS